MAHKRLGPAPLAKVAGPGNPLSPMERSTGFTTPHLSLQDHPDVVAILAARSRVHPATVAAHLAAFGIGEARS